MNVTSLETLSPFRYPGGKTWLLPISVQWLKSMPKVKEFFEPFAGGAITGLTAANLGLFDRVTIVEKDMEVAAVWKTILHGDAEWLANEIEEFDISPEHIEERLGMPIQSERDLAFRTLLRNRTNRGGIIAPGSSILKNGENGKGVKSRWYPATLKSRILKIASLSKRINFVEGDGVQTMKANIGRKDAAFFIDPPYTVGGKKAGKRLYSHSELDHECLFNITSQLKGQFLMTYDNVVRVKEMAAQYEFETRTIYMRNSHHAQLTELLIAKNMKWFIAS